MNFKKLSLLFFLGLFLTLSACDDDDMMPVCTQDSWVGTYSGTIACDDDTEDDVTVRITASGPDAIVIEYSFTNVSIEYDPLVFAGCDLDESQSGGGFTVVIDADLNGENLRIEETISDATDSETCVITATRD